MSRKDELLKLANFFVPKPGFGDPQSGTCERLLTIIRAKPVEQRESERGKQKKHDQAV